MTYLATPAVTLGVLTVGAAAATAVPDAAMVFPEGAGEIARLAVAGALGGVVRWITLRDGFIDGIASVVVGGICAVYLGPLVIPALTPVLGGLVVEEAGRSSLTGFLIGAGGTTFSGFLIDAWRMRRKKLEAGDAP